MNDADFMRSVLQRIATGPTMSKDLPREDAARAMGILLDDDADPVQAGLFLIALRMKRETDEELAGILEAIDARVERRDVAVDRLVTVVDPYDGYARGTPVAPFLPAVLAACGLRVLTHGVRSMGPKFGATQLQVLEAAGLAPAGSLSEAAIRLESDAVGWACIDQSVLAPKLAALGGLRTRIVKRPCLTTVEVAVRALVPRVASHLVTGFVHKGYPPVYARLARVGGFDASTIVRGVEGGVVPSLSQAARVFLDGGSGGEADGVEIDADEGGLRRLDIEPSMLGIDRRERTVPLPEALAAGADAVRSVRPEHDAFARELAAHAAGVGLAALAGEAGPARDSLVYAGAVTLLGTGEAATLAAGGERVRAVLDDGSARARWSTLVA